MRYQHSVWTAARRSEGPRASQRQVRGHPQDQRTHQGGSQDKCIGMTCQICYITCPTGSFEMEDGKAVWKFGMQLCGECGTCLYVCPVGAIEWSYPEAGTGIVLKYS